VKALICGKGYGAEARTRAPTRLRGTEASGYQLSRFTFDMKGEFVVKFSLDRGRVEESAGAEFQIAELHLTRTS
jgi:hypothetical protein